VGEIIPVRAKVRLGVLEPSDVVVEAYYSRLAADGSIKEGKGVDLHWQSFENGEHLYVGEVPARASGLHAFSVRILPEHEDVLIPNELPLVAWEEI
jgi:starch phosphorylase